MKKATVKRYNPYGPKTGRKKASSVKLTGAKRKSKKRK